MLPDRDTFLTEMSLILEGGVVSVTKQNNGQLSLFSTGIKKLAEDMLKQFDSVGEVNLDALCEKIPRLKLVKEIASLNKFMHWELEFADIESLEVDDPEEAIDYLLTDFYDLCDNTGIFIQIGESAELKENIKYVGRNHF